jgi:hypothetical protein
MKIYALLLLLLTLHTFAHSLALTKLELSFLQEEAVCAESITNDDGEEQAHRDDCKPPKHSFIDYSTFLFPAYTIPTYTPNVSRLRIHDPFQAHPRVYLEIVVPPDSLA